MPASMPPAIEVREGFFYPYISDFFGFVGRFVPLSTQVNVPGCLFLAGGIYGINSAANALRTGLIVSHQIVTREYDREEEPFWYWTHVIVFGVGGIVLSLWGASMLLGLWKPVA